MKKLIGLTLFLFSVSITKAQMPADAQKAMEEAQAKLKALQSNPEIAQKMKEAQHVMDSLKSDKKLQKQMQQQNASLKSAENKHPEIGDVQIPDLNNTQIPQMPDMNSLTSAMDKSSQQLKTSSQAIAETVPKQNLFHHADKLSRLSENNLLVLVNSILKSVKPTLDAITLSNLNAMLKDTSMSITNTGALLLATATSKDAALFLICHGILKNPKDAGAVNDLGAYYRDGMDYEKSLQCYFYADALDTGKNAAVNTNIGWAAAYYGDFDAANKYFDKALAIDDNFTSANEGKAMVAYAKGDIAALFQCLAKEIKYIGAGAGSGGPSDAFASTCGGIATENNAGNIDNQTTDPTSDHTYDNSNPDDGGAPDSPPGADADDVTYPRYKKAFVSKPEDIGKAIAECNKQNVQSVKEMKSRNAALLQQLNSLTPLGQKPYTDEEGYRIYPNNFQKYVNLLPPIEELFERRLVWYQQKLAKKLEPLGKDVANHDADMMKLYNEALAKCPILKDKYGGEYQDSNCTKLVQCTWLPKMYNSKNNDLDVVANMWNDYYDNIAKTIQWYLDATAPIISRVHEEGWNEYLNADREYRVRVAVIRAYGWWETCLGKIATSMCAFVKPPMPECPPVELRGVNAPDPFSKKPKHIKEFEGNCYDIKFDAGIGGIEENCHTTKFFIGAGPLKVFLEHVDDPIYQENHNYSNKIGATASADMMLGLNSDTELEDMGLSKEEIKDFGVGAKAGIDAKAEATAWFQFDANGQFTGFGLDASASAEAGVSATSHGVKTGASTSVGVDASKSWYVVAGQNGMVGSPTSVQVKTN